MKASKKRPNIMQLIRECDDIAASHWKLEASSRGQSYQKWLKQIKKTVDFIELLRR